MNPIIETASERVAELARIFDQAFAEPPVANAGDLQPLIRIRLAGEPLVLRADHITGIAKLGRIVPVLSRIPELMGVGAIRGALVPVFSLAALLGLGSRGAPCSWLALVHRESPVALAFDEFQGQVEIQRICLYDDETASPRRHFRQLARIGSNIHAVVDLPSVVEAIRKAAEPSRSS